MKDKQVTLKKDIMSMKKYVNNLQNCMGEVKECYLKRKDESDFKGIAML